MKKCKNCGHTNSHNLKLGYCSQYVIDNITKERNFCMCNNFEEEIPEEVLETSDDDTWKPCILCGGELTQVRKALFTCLKCNQEYVADEKDMRDTKPFRIIKK